MMNCTPLVRSDSAPSQAATPPTSDRGRQRDQQLVGAGDEAEKRVRAGEVGVEDADDIAAEPKKAAWPKLTIPP